MSISEYPVVSVHIPPVLRSLVGGHDEVMASGETVGEVLRAVGHTYPALGARILCGDGQLADGLQVFLGGVSLRQVLATPVAPEEVVTLVATGDIVCAVPPARVVEHAAPGDAALISVGS